MICEHYRTWNQTEEKSKQFWTFRNLQETQVVLLDYNLSLEPCAVYSKGTGNNTSRL